MVLHDSLSASLDETLSSSGLTWGSFQLLSAVKGGNGRLNQAEVAERLGITPPSLCEAVRSAAKKGHLEQIADPSDRRAKVLKLSSKGQIAVNTVFKELQRVNDDLESSLSPRTLETMKKGLENATNRLENRPQRPKSKTGKR